VAASKSSGDQELVELQRALLSGPTTGLPLADPETRKTVADRRAAQMEAYGQYVANQQIFHPDDNILAFDAGHPVPLEHVEKWRLEETGHVDRVATAEEARAGRRSEKKSSGEGGPGSSPAQAAPKTEK
jgi:hypothetical protein